MEERGNTRKKGRQGRRQGRAKELVRVLRGKVSRGRQRKGGERRCKGREVEKEKGVEGRKERKESKKGLGDSAEREV